MELGLCPSSELGIEYQGRSEPAGSLRRKPRDSHNMIDVSSGLVRLRSNNNNNSSRDHRMIKCFHDYSGGDLSSTFISCPNMDDHRRFKIGDSKRHVVSKQQMKIQSQPVPGHKILGS